MTNKFNISNKNALITGASGLLGEKHAKALLEIGANVILTDIDERLLSKTRTSLKSQKMKGEVICYVMDVSSEQSINEVSEKLKKDKIRVDILINNAAINPKQSSLQSNIRTTRLENFSIDRWNMELSVGLTGTFLCSKIFGSLMASDNKGGVILNISSDLSVIAPDQRIYRQENLDENLQPVKPITYSVIKTGIIGLTRYLASYWPEKGVRANALSPGGVYTNQDAEFVKRLSSLIPLGRMAKPDEYTSAIQFLCSDASAYMNGQNIVMDGGRTCW
jgi:NAD(P)-dependent dehydrogenase (short-subunit alcohol dehydrogenase family)